MDFILFCSFSDCSF